MEREDGLVLRRRRWRSRKAARAERRFFETIFVGLLQEIAVESEGERCGHGDLRYPHKVKTADLNLPSNDGTRAREIL